MIKKTCIIFGVIFMIFGFSFLFSSFVPLLIIYLLSFISFPFYFGIEVYSICILIGIIGIFILVLGIVKYINRARE